MVESNIARHFFFNVARRDILTLKCDTSMHDKGLVVPMVCFKRLNLYKLVAAT